MQSNDQPRSERELLERARNLAGRRIGELARAFDREVPADPVRAKGFIGELIEVALHASAGSRPVPDFEHLGVELKTIPVNRSGQPRESTHVCAVPLLNNVAITWETSLVRRKLQRVLWLPYLAEPATPLAERVIGSGLLWTPSPAQERVLKQDFEELMDKVCLGELESLSARQGTYLQIRPKAANARALKTGTDSTGRLSETLPRGYYLRASFTRQILREHYL